MTARLKISKLQCFLSISLVALIWVYFPDIDVAGLDLVFLHYF